MKHLPVTIVSPIRATGPIRTLIGALLIFHERLNTFQWCGVLISLLSFYRCSTTGKKEGIEFRRNKWIWFIVAGTLLGLVTFTFGAFMLREVNLK